MLQLCVFPWLKSLANKRADDSIDWDSYGYRLWTPTLPRLPVYSLLSRCTTACHAINIPVLLHAEQMHPVGSIFNSLIFNDL